MSLRPFDLRLALASLLRHAHAATPPPQRAAGHPPGHRPLQGMLVSLR